MTPADNEKMRDIRSALIRLFAEWEEIVKNYPNDEYIAWITSQFEPCLRAFGADQWK